MRALSNKLRDFLNHNQEQDASQGRPPDTEAKPEGTTENTEAATAEDGQVKARAEQETATADAKAKTDAAGKTTGQDQDAAGQTAQEQGQEQAEEEPAKPVHDPKDDQIEDLQKRLLRLQADFDNFRRRNAAEREELSTFVTMDIVGKYLKILDTFERGLTAAQKATDVASIVTGMENTQRLFLQTMTELGVKEIPALNQKFDPKLHEAVMRGQNPDLEDETIDAVFEKGYELRNHVIRHSKVRVINND